MIASWSADGTDGSSSVSPPMLWIASSPAGSCALRHRQQTCPTTHCCLPERAFSDAELRPPLLLLQRVVWRPIRSSPGLEKPTVSVLLPSPVCSSRRTKAGVVDLSRPLLVSMRGLVSNESASVFHDVPWAVLDGVVAMVWSPKAFPRAPLLASPSVWISAFATGYRLRRVCDPHSSSRRPVPPPANL